MSDVKRVTDINLKNVCQDRAHRANAPRLARVIRDDEAHWTVVMPEPKLSWQDVQDVMLDCDGKCYWCHAVVWLNGAVANIVPVGRGGTNDRDNLTWSCIFCSA